MIVISGCPRSGTSLMTFTVKTMLEDGGYSVLGEKFPQESAVKNRKIKDIKRNNESAKSYDLRMYLNKLNERPQMKTKNEMMEKHLEKSKNMNPTGFWEGRYSVQGCSWHIGIEDAVKGKKVCKIVSQGLLNTDPSYIDKIIFMCRNPRAVAKSQEQLKHNPQTEAILDMDKKSKVHDVTMFIKVSKEASRYFIATGIKPLCIDYDLYCEQPEIEIEKIKDYLGEGDTVKGLSCLNMDYKRSTDQKVVDPSFDLADEIFEKMLIGDWEAILKMSVTRLTNKKQPIPCVRMRQQVIQSDCLECQKCGDFTKSAKEFSENTGINWEKLPCVWECGADPSKEGDDSYKTIDESIAENHWSKV